MTRTFAQRLGPPSHDQLRRYAARHQLSPTTGLDDELPRVLRYLEVLRRLDDLTGPPQADRSVRRPSRAPGPAEDPYRAIRRVCAIGGAAHGPLAGLRIGIKDVIAIAGVPMGHGGPDLPDIVPGEDAVVVERLLAGGAVITATTSTSTDVLNPVDRRFSPGGSSSGSAAAVAGGLVDAALGADQGGSLRVPAAWCGLVGMKATHGLVPSYGLSYWDHTLDHIGPITRTVADNARLLQVLAGADDRDPQWVRGDPVPADYSAELDRGARGLRIGVITEAVLPSGCAEDTLAAFHDACRTLSALDAQVTTVSLSLWPHAHAIWLAAVIRAVAVMAESYGQGSGHLGRIDLDRLLGVARHRLAGLAPGEPADARAMLLTAEHLRQQCAGLPFARAHNLRLDLRAQVDQLFRDVDLLICPTWPSGPDRVQAGESDAGPPTDGDPPPVTWTCPFNLSGHPALTVPFGTGNDGMPRAVQIVGPRFGEQTVYRAGAALESR